MSRRFFIFAWLALAALLAMTGCILRWQLPPASPLRYNFKIAWENQLEHPVVLKPLAIEDQVALVSGDTLYTFCQDDGLEQERRLVGSGIKAFFTEDEGMFLTASSVTALWNLKNEEPLWASEASEPPLAAARGDGRYAFMYPQSLMLFRPRLFSPLHLSYAALLKKDYRTRSVGRKRDIATQTWTDSVLLSEGVVYAGTEEGQLFAFSIGERKAIWSFTARGAIRAPPARWKKRLYVGSDDKNFYCLSTRNASRNWTLETGGPVRSRPVVFENAVFVISYDLILYALRTDNGHRLWNAHMPGRVESPPLVTPYGLAVNPIYSREIHLYGMGDGAPRGTFVLSDPEDYFTSEMLYAGDRLYAGTYKGKVLALDFVEMSAEEAAELEPEETETEEAPEEMFNRSGLPRP